MRLLPLMIAFSLVAASPAATATGEPAIKVYKSRGSVQCTTTFGTPPEVMRKALDQAGIAVDSTACGTDGKIYQSMCGSPDGSINIFVIPLRKAAQAALLGFARLDGLPDAKQVKCQ